uniref:Uncharacterized protein n=1 Tax=Arion vulgaris TaxID=1028688 RepID=A0A0B7BJ85_9EUPU
MKNKRQDKDVNLKQFNASVLCKVDEHCRKDVVHTMFNANLTSTTNATNKQKTYKANFLDCCGKEQSWQQGKITRDEKW